MQGTDLTVHQSSNSLPSWPVGLKHTAAEMAELVTAITMATLAMTAIGRHGPQIDLKHTAIAYSWALGDFSMKKIVRAIQGLATEGTEPITAAAVARHISANDMTADEKNRKWEHYAE